MTLDEINEDDAGLPDLPLFKTIESNSDKGEYNRMVADKKLLAEALRLDVEKVIRFHLMFEAEDGEGSRAKRNPILGRAFIVANTSDARYEKIREAIRVTVESYRT